VVQFQKAVSADPEFTAARVALATTHIALGYNFQVPRVHFEKARKILANAAQEKRPLVEAVVNDAVLAFYHEWNWAAAARGADFTTNNDSSAVETHACFLHCAQTKGAIADGLLQIKAAQHFHPDSIALRGEVACAAYYGGNFGEAERTIRDTLKADPENPMLYWGLARSLVQQGHLEAAAAELKIAQGKPGGDWTGILSEVAYIHALQKRTAAAYEVIAQLHAREKSEYVDQYLFAMAFAGLGNSREVFRHLEQAAADRSTWIPNLALDPKFAAFRSDPRYVALLRTLKLEPR
jgi:Flp pilus assembly protein TadD